MSREAHSAESAEVRAAAGTKAHPRPAYVVLYEEGNNRTTVAIPTVRPDGTPADDVILWFEGPPLCR